VVEVGREDDGPQARFPPGHEPHNVRPLEGLSGVTSVPELEGLMVSVGRLLETQLPERSQEIPLGSLAPGCPGLPTLHGVMGQDPDSLEDAHGIHRHKEIRVRRDRITRTDTLGP
jgi:hypothetical protein